MLETVREYGLERLADSGEEAADPRRPRRLLPGARRADGAAAARVGGAGGVRGAGARARQPAGRAGLVRGAGEAEAFLRLAAALGYFWSITGHWTEGNAWLERALAADPRPSPARLEALENLGENAGYQGDIARAEAALREGLALARRLGAGAKVSSMLHALGAQRVDQGRYEEGEVLLAESVAEAQRAGDRYDEALSLAHLGIAAWGRGDQAEAVARLEAARALAREAGHPLPAAVASPLPGPDRRRGRRLRPGGRGAPGVARLRPGGRAHPRALSPRRGRPGGGAGGGGAGGPALRGGRGAGRGDRLRPGLAGAGGPRAGWRPARAGARRRRLCRGIRCRTGASPGNKSCAEVEAVLDAAAPGLRRPLPDGCQSQIEIEETELQNDRLRNDHV